MPDFRKRKKPPSKEELDQAAEQIRQEYQRREDLQRSMFWGGLGIGLRIPRHLGDSLDELQSTPHRRTRQRHDSTKVRIAEIKRDHPERANDIRYICAKLDATDTPLPPESQWEDKSKQRTWVGNYAHKGTRSAVQRYVSEVQPAPPKRKRHS